MDDFLKCSLAQSQLSSSRNKIQIEIQSKISLSKSSWQWDSPSLPSIRKNPRKFIPQIQHQIIEKVIYRKDWTFGITSGFIQEGKSRIDGHPIYAYNKLQHQAKHNTPVLLKSSNQPLKINSIHPYFPYLKRLNYVDFDYLVILIDLQIRLSWWMLAWWIRFMLLLAATCGMDSRLCIGRLESSSLGLSPLSFFI